MDPVMPIDEGLQRTMDRAYALAQLTGSTCTSAHLLAALLVEENEARPLLYSRELTLERVQDRLAALGHDEPEDTLAQVNERCQRMAQTCGSARVSSLHLLLVLAAARESLAFRLLSAMAVDQARLRTDALARIAAAPRSAAPSQRSSPTDTRTDPEGSRTPARARPAESTDAAPERPPPLPGHVLVGVAVEAGPMDHLDPFDPRLSAERRRTRPPGAASWFIPPTPVADAEPAAAAEAASGGALEETTPELDALGRDLTAAARRGELGPLVARKELVERLLDLLGQRAPRLPCLVGRPGVGKTAVLEGLARLQLEQPDRLGPLRDRVLYSVDLRTLFREPSRRTRLADRWVRLLSEVERARGRSVVFLESLEALGEAAPVDGQTLLAVAAGLATSIARGVLPGIATATEDGWAQLPPFLRRCLEVVRVPELSTAECVEVLRARTDDLARHHQISYAASSLQAAASLAGRISLERALPRSALELLDLAGSRARRLGLRSVGWSEVAQLLAGRSGPSSGPLPVAAASPERIETFLAQRIVGHREAIEEIGRAIRRGLAGFSTPRPLAALLFLGPVGVGRAATARAIAEYLFGRADAVCRVDCDELADAHALVPHLARRLSRPDAWLRTVSEVDQLLLVQNVERAERQSLQILSQILEDGWTSDERGRRLRFGRTAVVMTSTLEPPQLERLPRPLRGLLLGPLVFEPLTPHQRLEVARLLVQASSARLRAASGFSYEATDEALLQLLHRAALDPPQGLRGLPGAIEALFERRVADEVLLRPPATASTLRVSCAGEELSLEWVPE